MPETSMPIHAASKRNHLALLDAARSVAALAVVCWHWQNLRPLAAATAAETAHASFPFYKYLSFFYDGGWLAVDFFFMLSGFVMAMIYRTSIMERRTNASRFAWLRFSRLYPLHFAMLIAIVIMQGVWVAAHGAMLRFPAQNPNIYDGYHLVLNLFMASEWGLQRGPSFNDPIWSVSIEVLLYAVFFVAARFVGLRSVALVMLSTLGFAMYAGNVAGGLGRGLFCFFIGCFLCKLASHIETSRGRRSWRWGTMTCLAVALTFGWFCLQGHWPSRGSDWIAHEAAQLPHVARFEPKIAERLGRLFTYLMVVVGIYPFLLMSLVAMENRLRRVAAPLTKLGKISYSSYLIHFPLMMLCVMVFSQSSMEARGMRGDVIFVAFMVALIVLSFLSHDLLEMPIQKRLRALFRQRADSIPELARRSEGNQSSVA